MNASFRRRLLFLLFAIMAMVPAAAGAQQTVDESDLLGRVNGDLTVGANESYGIVAVISGDVRVDGTVREVLFVVDGDATIAGTVDGDITVINGTLTLLAGSAVENISLIGSTLSRDPAAEVDGTITEEDTAELSWQIPAAVSLIIWAGISVLLILMSLALAGIAGRQLLGIAGTITRSPGTSLLGTAAVWIGGPTIGILLIITVIGIPAGLVILLGILPLLWVIGYIAAATRLGAQVTGLTKRVTPTHHPYLAALLGMVLMQLIGLIPGIGGLIVGVAGLVGAGATLAYAIRAWRNRERDWRLAPPSTEGA